MQFSCNKEIILKEISVAQDIISTRNAMSILSNVLLEVSEDALTIKATDLKVGFETRIPVNVDSPGSTTVFCDKLLGILRAFPGGEIQFIHKEDSYLEITNGSSITFDLRSIDADKFPEIQKTGDDSFFSMPQREFIDMIGQTIFAISDDETRYFMNGVYMEKSEGKLVMVATDGRRLSYIANTSETTVPDFEGIIIPPKVLALVQKLASAEGDLQIAVADKILFIRFDSQKVTSTLIEGQFPNYSRVIPDSQDFEVKMNRNELLDGLKRVSLLAEQKSKRIYLTAEGDKATLKSEENDIGKAEESMACEFGGEKSVFAMNHVYLSDPLKVMEGNSVIMKFTDTSRAVTLVSDPEAAYFHIIMPMQSG